MAEKNSVPKKRFKMVTTSHKVVGGALRDDPSITVHPSGLGVCNRGSTDIADEVANTSAESYLVKFGVDEETKTIAVYVATSEEPGAMRIRRYKSKGGTRISFHMGGVWKEHPKLRPSSKMDYLVYSRIDEDGIPYMEIALQAGLEGRKGSTPNPSAESKKTAAGEQ